MDRYKNKYRVASARASWWNYGWNGAYFITICAANREHIFGKISNGKMTLSKTGVIVDILWNEIPNHAPFVELGDFVIMPNHIHGILILDKPDVKNADININTGTNVETLHATSLQPRLRSIKNEKMAAISPKSNSVSAIIQSYKSAVTKHANRLELPIGWQSRFHDHIIRNNEEYQRISDYIINNPANWKEDKFYSP